MKTRTIVIEHLIVDTNRLNEEGREPSASVGSVSDSWPERRVPESRPSRVLCANSGVLPDRRNSPEGSFEVRRRSGLASSMGQYRTNRGPCFWIPPTKLGEYVSGSTIRPTSPHVSAKVKLLNHGGALSTDIRRATGLPPVVPTRF